MYSACIVHVQCMHSACTVRIVRWCYSFRRYKYFKWKIRDQFPFVLLSIDVAWHCADQEMASADWEVYKHAAGPGAAHWLLLIAASTQTVPWSRQVITCQSLGELSITWWAVNHFESCQSLGEMSIIQWDVNHLVGCQSLCEMSVTGWDVNHSVRCQSLIAMSVTQWDVNHSVRCQSLGEISITQCGQVLRLHRWDTTIYIYMDYWKHLSLPLCHLLKHQAS